ncbi:tRNA (5-methylaminomethyl-2-thiouridine)(34)-methyltransferase MnmD [Parapedobacter koreensis]|uniref:tRNA U34 5-methylaminomethyl-2-thiouridine-forming methyltransferase MnmC n=1 Tax=Parapedobacter koreensis TaxID=332977 RepID=A0A1H7GBF9_9SPHI|nr:tRNA (5-methylaminomethyl-2-thiouridine)(34)-methyltransferase MnmD [Parapedobacter koreensis]SEK35593.1 tRNA U34 5-methylaminomethyl-2-thiouridine-forming methyltransferase MnmC [Parapedobacter koreensis]
MMEFVVTADGSKTLYHPDVGEHYHSLHGAVQESKHVFLGMGLQHFLALHKPEAVSVLEIGFGTGLNFLLTADYCALNDVKLHYTGIEAYPLATTMVAQTGYDAHIGERTWSSFLSCYSDSLLRPQTVADDCLLEIIHADVLEFNTDKRFDVLYFDAFAAVHQPEMWTTETLAYVCQYLKPGGIFVTYAITGQLKRTMRALGFAIEKVPGAPGKREMLRATKL